MTQESTNTSRGTFSDVNVEVDLDETQAAALEPTGKKKKENDVTRKMLDDAAKRAAKEAMREMASENFKIEQRLMKEMGRPGC